MKEKAASSAVAVIGMACRYPGANDLRTFWENILAKRRQFRPFPDSRLSLPDYYDPDPSTSDKMYCNKAALIDGFHFDWRKHRIPESSFQSADIAHWLALDVALQAFADAGFSGHDALHDRTGVILGNTLTGEQSRAEGLRLRWPFVRRSLEAAAAARGLSSRTVTELAQTMETCYKSVFAPVTEDTLAGSLSNTIAGRICNYLDFHGGGYTVDGACSSGLIAIATAASALRNRDLDLALAGGVDISLDTFELIGFSKVGALTKTDMHVYDRRGSGFIPGEGCGFVMLKRLEDALKDGNYVYAVIRGWGISSDGKGGLTAPSVKGQAIALKRAYECAGLSALELDFIEGHGTGTTVGDRVELEAIARVRMEEGQARDRSCGITSLKSIIGHTKAASGIGGFIKAVMAVNRRVLPPTANCSVPNEVFEDPARSLYPITTGELRFPTDKLRAGVSAMGFGGINCHVVMESSADAPSTKLTTSLEERKLLASHQATELFVFSGNSPENVLDKVRKVKKLALGMSEGERVDLAAQLSRELDEHALVRAALIAGSPDQIIDDLQSLEELLEEKPLQPGTSFAGPGKNIFLGHAGRECRVGFLFPGQGSQQLNMSEALVKRHEWTRRLVKIADELSDASGNDTVSECIYRPLDKAVDLKQIENWSTLLRATQIAQPALCLSSLLWMEKLDRLGIKPVAVGGHSLGELTAFHAAGAFDEEALLKLARLRGEAMGAPGNECGAMAGLACSYDAAMDIVGRVPGYVVVANINSPGQSVISGERSSVDKAVGLAADKGIATHMLPVSNAFHSKFVSAAAERLRGATIIPDMLHETGTKLFSCLSGRRMEQGLILREHFAVQAVSQVDFVSLVKAVSLECDIILEVGPGNVLSNLSNAINGTHGPVCLPVESKAGKDVDLNRALAEGFVRGAHINWEELYEDRLVRPYIPASDRIFIDNPCERSFKFPAPEASQISNEDGLIRKLFTDADRMSPALISEYLSRRGRFLGAIIKADGAFPAPHAQDPREALPDQREYDKPAETMPTRKETPNAGDNAGAVQSISDMLLELVEKRTGFPRESLSMEHRLLDDLNLDSIKAAELIAAAAMRLKLAGNLNASQFANARLAEIADVLQNLSVTGGEAQEKEAAAPEAPVAGQTKNTWVRNFIIQRIAEPLTSMRTNDLMASWAEARVLILSEETEAAHATALKSDLTAYGAQASSIFFSEAPLRLREEGVEFTHYITILPGSSEQGLSPDTRLRAMVERLRTSVMLQSAVKIRRANATIAYIQFGGGRCGAEPGDGGLEQCCSTAFAASVHHEHPELKVRVLDFPSLCGPAVVSRYALHELSTSGGYAAAEYDRELIRRIPVPVMQEPASYPKRSIGWSSDDVVLATGGAKGITAECALAFARATGVRMALVGSSPHPEDTPGHGSGADITRILGRFSSENMSCRYYCCDITDANAVNLLVQRLRRELGPITGVIHGAGLNRPNRTEQVSSEEAFKEIGPKVIGAMNLCLALKDAPPKLFAGFSSIIGVTGMPGNAWYAFSNEALDVLLRAFGREHPATATLSIAFSVWEDVGMGARMGSVQHLSKMGIGAIPATEGIGRFLRLLLHDPDAPQVIVTARLGGLDTWSPRRFRTPPSRFLENIVALEPNVEVVVRAHLTLERDPYIKDHLWRGTYLFPTVFGLEAMSQAVSSVTGHTDFNTLLIEDVRLERPITVFPDTGCTIEIHASVPEREPAGSLQRVRAGIRCEQTGFSQDHFSATFILGNEAEQPGLHIELPKIPLELDPQRDLYGSLLFQGPLYRRIRKIYSLTSQKCVFLSELHTAPKVSREYEAGSWLLGDPFFRDSLLHAPQLPLARDICLPLRIERIERYGVQDRLTESLVGVAVIEDRADSEVTATVCMVDKNGRVKERLTGYVLKVMEHHQDYPTAEEIADPGKRDENILRGELEKRAVQLDVSAPEIASTHIPGIHHYSKPERHEREAPLLRETVRRALGNNGIGREVRITWLESGKPRLESPVDTGLDISLSHSEGTVLGVAGSWPQGCDLELVTGRSRDEWLVLFGNARAPLFQRLTEGPDSLDRAGTRIWAAIEALHKIVGMPVPDLAMEKQSGDAILFKSALPDADCHVLTFPVKLTGGAERMIALAVKPAGERMSIIPEKDRNIHEEKLHYNFDSYKVDITDGPRGQTVFVYRFPVTFKEASNPSRTLYFSHYFAWVGKLREYVIQPIYRNLVEAFSTGKWGMVTNHAETRIAGDAQSGDVIEGRVWFEKVSGKDRSRIDMCFEWWKNTHDGKRERIAFSSMSTTWVSILGHGTVEVRPLPDFGNEFLNKVLPRADAPEAPAGSFEHEPSFDFGQELYREPAGPLQASAFIKELIFSTTLEDSNLVGNIYFSNYYLWQGRVRDCHISEIAPEYFDGSGKQGELRCVRCKVNHISEAMPFDRIAVRMHRTAVHENGVKLYFDYYRVGPDGARKKLGQGEHEAVWYAPTAEGIWTPAEMPASIRASLLPKDSAAGSAPSVVMQPASRGRYDVIVVGSGIGGLSAAALLSKQGKRVLVVEQHDKPGGFCTSWERSVKHDNRNLSFVFEAGVHDIALFGDYSHTLKTLGNIGASDRIEWRRVDHEYIIGDLRLKVPRELSAYIHLLSEHFPAEKSGLSAFFKEVGICFEELYARDWRKPANKALHIDTWRNVSFASLLDRYFKDHTLKRILSVLASYCTDDPSRLDVLTTIPFFGYYMGGGYYPAGGAQVLPDAMASVIRANSGEVRLRTPVSKILVESGRVTGIRLKNNELIHADVVISNADVRRTFLDLVESGHLRPHFRQRIEKLRPSNSAFMVSLGIDLVPDVNPATSVMDEAGQFSVMVPSKVDPSLAPRGCACVTLIRLLSNEQSVAWNRDDPGYRRLKKQYGDELIKRAEQAIPGLKDHIVFRQDATPATFTRYAGTTDGAIYGLAADEWRPSLKTPIHGLYLAGAGISARPGVEDAVYSGIMAADAILHEENAAESRNVPSITEGRGKSS